MKFLLPGEILELPPHARRILFDQDTAIEPLVNYLRMRGEYQKPHLSCAFSTELPPHARRIPSVSGSIESGFGTTSACAENTFAAHHPRQCEWNYLRMRGEYEVKALLEQISKELPPHARRIRAGWFCEHKYRGTTSACAENTLHLISHNGKSRNYLRMRGE